MLEPIIVFATLLITLKDESVPPTLEALIYFILDFFYF